MSVLSAPFKKPYFSNATVITFQSYSATVSFKPKLTFLRDFFKWFFSFLLFLFHALDLLLKANSDYVSCMHIY